MIINQSKVFTDRILSVLLGDESKLSAIARIIGCMIAPPRAVLLGVTGAKNQLTKSQAVANTQGFYQRWQ